MVSKRLMIVSILLVVILSGCSTRYAYNNLDWLAYWYITDYIELDDPQEALVKQSLAKTLSWHRTQELPRYREKLIEIRTQLDSPNSKVNWRNVMVFVRDAWLNIRAEFISEITVFLPHASEAQISNLFSKLKEKRQDDLEEISEDPEERTQERTEQLVETLSDFIGDLTPEQTSIVDDYIGSSYDNRRDYLLGNLIIQKTVEEVILAYVRGPSDEGLIQISQLLNNTDAVRDAEFMNRIEENRQLTTELFERLHVSLTEEQRQHLREVVSDWLARIDQLMK